MGLPVGGMLLLVGRMPHSEGALLVWDGKDSHQQGVLHRVGGVGR